jgi:hypothetical protein
LNHHFQPKNGHYYWWLTNCTVNIQKNIFIHEQIFMGLFMFCVDCWEIYQRCSSDSLLMGFGFWKYLGFDF